MKLLSHVRLFATPLTTAYRAPLSKGFSRQEYSSGLPFPSPEDLPDPRDQTQVSCTVGKRFTVWATREALYQGELGSNSSCTFLLCMTLEKFLNFSISWFLYFEYADNRSTYAHHRIIVKIKWDSGLETT